MLISSRSINKHVRHRQFLFLIELAFWIEDLPRMLPTKFRFIWQSAFRGEDFLEITQLETRIVCGGHVCSRIGRLNESKLGRKHPWKVLYEECLYSSDLFTNMAATSNSGFWLIDFFKKSFHLAKRFQRRRFFRNHPIRNENCLWWPCLFTDRN
jgi:hypothetical protein